MSAKKGKQNTILLKYAGAVPYEGKHTDKVIIRVGMRNKENNAVAYKSRVGRTGS